MGVHGLWDLLSPVGRRVSVETLAGKRLAIDASIWLVQFVKAMRDERGEMVRNAHLLGFFRRICKLLYLRTKPVFVFDGGTPVLKRRTVIARRRQRENAQAKVRKTAEKLLLNQLKAMGVKELAKELENQRMKKDGKGKKIISDEGNTAKEEAKAAEICNQEMVDEMLAASLAAEERDAVHCNAGAASTSSSGIPLEDVIEDDDEEIILPVIDGSVDPAVLAALPPSMQLDLLVQMRERLMAENRQKYQKVKKAPQRFSELQIEAYLKTVAFRREIDEVQKAAAGKGVGGMQTARIASEADREFIFSSSFTGDKQLLTSAAVEKSDKSENEDSSLNLENTVYSACKTSGSSQTSRYKVVRGVRNNDQRPHVDSHVSRRRAMGIQMTRDLQRNLDLMKEFEQDNINVNSSPNAPSGLDGREHPSDIIPDVNGENPFSLCKRLDQNVSAVNNALPLEISFEDKELCKPLDGDDEFFVSLAAGAPVNLSLADDTLLKDQNLGSSADCEWEEGITGASAGDLYQDPDVKSSHVGASNDNDEDEIEWEDGTSNVCIENPCPVESKPKSRGFLEEETALQEAIRKSLEDSQAVNIIDLADKRKTVNKIVHMALDDPLEVNNQTSELLPQLKDDSVAVESSFSPICQSLFSDGKVETKAAETADLEMQTKSCAVVPDETEVVSVGSAFQCLDVQDLAKNAEASGSVSAVFEGSERSYEGIFDTSSVISETPVSFGSTSSTESAQPNLKNMGQSERENFMMCNSSITHENSTGQEEFMEEPTSNTSVQGKVAENESHNDLQEPAGNMDIPWSTFEEGGTSIEVPGIIFEDELQNLGEELTTLEDEQRKLERNADFMNNEMFVECQELLQMFGIPYIIAPMEAEAQCAYMECAGLVDGVVTDDSDVFLFGARSVYKNIFDDRKYVETYFMKDMEDELGLTREKLIRVAMLLGSDYTEGVSGIGIVNAIEVINAFPEEDGLSVFREWIESPDPNIFGSLGMPPKAISKTADGDFRQNEDKEDPDNVTKTRKIFMNKHRNVSKNWHIPPSFPSHSVVDAYKSPQVDKSTEPFSWGKPDLFVLRRFSWEKFGWDSQKVNELLLPVLQEYNKRETQLRLEAFYSFNERFAKIRSKRIKQAVKGLTINSPMKKMDSSKTNGTSMESDLGGDSVENDADDGVKVCKRKGGAQKELGPLRENIKKKRAKESGGSGSVRRKTKVGSGKRKANPVSESCNTCQSKGDHESQVRSLDISSGLRRSKRSRKACTYTEDEKEDENVDLLNDSNPSGFTKTSRQESDREQCSEHDNDHEDFDKIGYQVGEESLLDRGLHGGLAPKDDGFFADDADKVVAGRGFIPEGSGFDGSYLENGGGFCIDEDDSNDFSNEHDFDKIRDDGFMEAGCMAVSDADEVMEVDSSGEGGCGKDSRASGVARGKLLEQVAVSPDLEHDQKPEPATRSGKFPPVNDSVQDHPSSLSNAFKAMPNLRRKRKS